jgi:hypothetical protein
MTLMFPAVKGILPRLRFGCRCLSGSKIFNALDLMWTPRSAISWRGRRPGRSGSAGSGGNQCGSAGGDGSDGAGRPAADSARREAGGGRPRPARGRRHPGEFIMICCCWTTFYDGGSSIRSTAETGRALPPAEVMGNLPGGARAS